MNLLVVARAAGGHKWPKLNDPSMKITSVEGILMSYGFPKPVELPFVGGHRTILKRDAMLIRVKADNGLVGYAPGPAHEDAAADWSEAKRW